MLQVTPQMRVLVAVDPVGLEGQMLQSLFLPALEARVEAGDRDHFYEVVLQQLIGTGQVEFCAVDVGDLRWCEIDDHRDLELAEQLFAPADERYDLVRSLHGGYRRHLVTDHSYIYNPYFPSHLKKMTPSRRNIRCGNGGPGLGHHLSICDPLAVAPAHGFHQRHNLAPYVSVMTVGGPSVAPLSNATAAARGSRGMSWSVCSPISAWVATRLDRPRFPSRRVRLSPSAQ